MNIKKLYNNITLWHDSMEYPENESEIIVTSLHTHIPFAFCKYIKTADVHVIRMPQFDEVTKQIMYYYFPFHNINKWMYVSDFEELVD